MNQFAITELDTIDSAINVHPQISGEKVVWLNTKKNKNKILLYDGKKTYEIVSPNVYGKSFPKISNNNVVWTSVDSDGKTQIFLDDGQNIIRLNNNKQNKTLVNSGREILSFQISGNNVVWCSRTSLFIPRSHYMLVFANPITDKAEYGSIFFHNGKEAKLLNKNQLGSSPQVSGDRVVWQEIISLDDREDSEIFLYDGKETIQLTNNDVYDYDPQVSEKNVVWISGRSKKNLFLYNGKETIQLNDPNIKSSSPKIDGNNVVWTGIDSEGNSEIFFYNGKKTVQLTDNEISDNSPQISGDNIVWLGGGGWDEIFFYNGKETIQLTNNQELSRIDKNPKIDGNKVVWQRFNLADSTTSVMLATIHDTKSSLIPQSNRNYKIITSSTIIILGLFFLVWLKKQLAKC